MFAVGARLKTAICRSGWLAMIPFLTGGLYAQTTLVLSSATTTTESASLELSLDSSSGVTPAAIQWTFQYPSTSIRSIDIVDGPVLGPAGKTVVCAGDASAFTCMAIGLDAELIPDGVIATVNVALEPIDSTTAINIVDALGVSAPGDPIAIAATGGTVARRSRLPLPPRRPLALPRSAVGKGKYAPETSL